MIADKIMLTGQSSKLYDVKKLMLNKNLDMETHNSDNTDKDTNFVQPRKTVKLNPTEHNNKIVVLKNIFGVLRNSQEEQASTSRQT